MEKGKKKRRRYMMGIFAIVKDKEGKEKEVDMRKIVGVKGQEKKEGNEQLEGLKEEQ